MTRPNDTARVTLTKPALWGAVALAATLALAGCASDGPRRDDYAGGGFFRDDEAKSQHAIAAVQAAKGAANDGMLHPVHFEGDRLNALGRDKLGKIVSARTDADSATTVYLDLPPSDNAALTTARRAAVTEHLERAGLSPDQFDVVDGPNAGRRAYAAENLARQNKTESTRGGGATAGSASLFGRAAE